MYFRFFFYFQIDCVIVEGMRCYRFLDLVTLQSTKIMANEMTESAELWSGELSAKSGVLSYLQMCILSYLQCKMHP